MKTAHAFSEIIRNKFPAISQKADGIHIRQWGSLDREFAYSWFESLANALNDEMCREKPYETHKALFNFISASLPSSDEEVYKCIDVAFVENLFWQVPSRKCADYWKQMPASLRTLYLDFHHREP